MAAFLVHFWKTHPALFYALPCLFSCYAALSPSWLLLFPCIALWLPCWIANWKIPLFLNTALFLSGWGFFTATHRLPPLPPEGIEGIAHVQIEAIQIQHAPFGKRWLYRCHLVHFFGYEPLKTGLAARPLVSAAPCIIPIACKKQLPRPPADRDYFISSRLVQKNGSYQLKPQKNINWQPIPKTWSWAEKRVEWKKTAADWIRLKTPQPLAAAFLAGLATGDFEEQGLRGEFARFGLLHLIAISGFHFSALAVMLGLTLHFIKNLNLRAIILSALLGMYFFFLGFTPSIFRAWLMATCGILGGILEKPGNSLNFLGAALLLICIVDPFACQTIGFQFSFLATAAILLLYQPLVEGLDFLFAKRSLSQLLEMNRLNQHGYLLLSLFKQALALSLAINLFVFPLTLYHFHQFPWMGLFYNLFFPLLATVSLFLLIGSSFLFWVPFLGDALYSLNGTYTDLILKLTYQVPPSAGEILHIESFSPPLLVLYLCGISLASILAFTNPGQKRKNLENQSV